MSFHVKHTSGIWAQDIQGYDYMAHYHGSAYEDRNNTRVEPYRYFENIGIEISFEKAILTVKKVRSSLTFDIKRYIEKLIKEHGQNTMSLTQKDFTLEKENDTLRVKIEFQNLNKSHHKDTKMINFNSRIFFKFKGEQ